MTEIPALTYEATPIQEVQHPVLSAEGVKLFVKREDLNNQYVQGNKWWKLKYNIEEALRQGHETMLTFGGAYSNHILATAAAASAVGFRSVGIIRGEECLPLNPILSSAKRYGMEIHYISREQYANKTNESFLSTLARTHGCFYHVPEGGSNFFGVAGMEDFGKLLPADFDTICCPIGTGASLAGIIRSRRGKGNIIGFAVMKGGESWINEITKYNPGHDNWQVIHNYHFGGYAKSTSELEAFLIDFKAKHGIPLETVYTGKMMFGILDLASKKHFLRGSTILAIHTGGLTK